MKTSLESFIHRENIKLFKKQLADPTKEAQRKTLLRLLAEEEAKDEQFVPKPKAAYCSPLPYDKKAVEA